MRLLRIGERQLINLDRADVISYDEARQLVWVGFSGNEESLWVRGAEALALIRWLELTGAAEETPFRSMYLAPVPEPSDDIPF